MPIIRRRKTGVGVVEMTGVIGGSLKVPVYTRLLEGVRRDRRLKAVLLEIDSPGGTASGSEVLFKSLERVAREKPVVAYIRGTGASGAYYISCAANKIVTLPSSLVGSIGVISLRPVLQQLLEKVGISFNVYKGGHLKDMSGFWRGPTPEEEGKMGGLIEEIYNNFVDVVASGRRLDLAAAKELATGEIFTGRTAKNNGLVDELGDFDTALDMAAELGGTRPRSFWITPKRPLFERAFGRLGRPGMGERLFSEVEPLLTGGMYYMAPGLLAGYPEGDR